MKVLFAPNLEAAYRSAAEMIIQQVQDRPDCRLGLATGGTAEGIYPYVAQAYEAGTVDFSRVSTVNLDEYRGLGPEHPQSYAYFMHRHLFSRVNIPADRICVPSGLGEDGEACRAFSALMEQWGPPDLQLLGSGSNGHIAFNEPGNTLEADAHIQQLHEDTIEANARFFTDPAEVPRSAITMGMGDILKAKKILLVAGANKAQAMEALLMTTRITTMIPVTLLRLHPDVTVITERSLAEKIGWKL